MRFGPGFIAQLIAVLVLAVLLSVQILIIRPRMSLHRHLEELTKARTSDDVTETLRAVKAALGDAPGDTRLGLLHAHSLFTAGDLNGAISAYKEIAAKADSSEVGAAALTGRAAALVARWTARPAEKDIRAALDLLEEARALAPGLPDVAAAIAVARTWAGDEEGAKEAMAEVERLQGEGPQDEGHQVEGLQVEGLQGERRPLGVDAAAACYCLRGFEAVRRGEIDAARAAVEGAAWIMQARTDSPERRTGLGHYVGRSIEYLDLEAASRPGAPEELRRRMLKRLEAEGPWGLSDAKTYPVFLRASAAASRGEGRMRSVGLDFLERAIRAHQDDPIPVIYKIAALMDDHAKSWAVVQSMAEPAEGRAALRHLAQGGGQSSSRAAGRAGVISVYDCLPGQDLPRPGMPSSPDRSLASIEKTEMPLVRAVIAAAEKAAALSQRRGDGGAELALSLARFLYIWKMRQAELSATVAKRREREMKALEAVALAERLLGDRMPRGQVSAWLYRNKGVVLAGRLDTEGALAAFRKSLEIRPDQKDLAKLLSPEASSLKVVATYPDPSPLHPFRPLVGVEFRLPLGVRSLEECTTKATLGPVGGAAKPIEPRVTGTGLWYLPGPGDLPDGDMEARFSVADPLGRRAAAAVRFRVDTSPPVIVESFPASGATTAERRPLFRVKWKDLSGIDPETVTVILEPVTAEFFRQILVEAGRQKTLRFAEPKWRRGDSAVKGVGGTAGEIFTAATPELPAGSYKLTVYMEDNYRHAGRYVWKFTVR